MALSEEAADRSGTGAAGLEVQRTHDDPVDASHLEPISIWRSVSPYALVPIAVGMGCYAAISRVEQRLASGVYVGCALLITAVFLRQVFAIVKTNRLYQRLRWAYAHVASQNDRLQALASRDSMTGLANHGAFQEYLRVEADHAQSAGTTLALILIDVDFFKRYNDMFGHPAGDKVLKDIGRVLCGRVRSGDLVARYGGEEFAVILPGASLAAAQRVSESMRNAVAVHQFEHSAVTISLGAAVLEHPYITPAELVDRADQALYGAKRAGRNCVACWHPDGLGESIPGVKVISRRTDPVDKLARYLSEATTSSIIEQYAFGDLLSGPEGQMLDGVLAALDLRDCETVGHSVRVARFSLRLAVEASRQGLVTLRPRDLQELVFGALLHDVGKIGIPDSILLKADSLTTEEWQVVHAHPQRGAEFLRKFPYLQGAIPVVRYHHEWWDGSGYPDALRGEEIPLTARIFALADAFDAMTTERLYRPRMAYETACEEMKRMSGTQFDPMLLDAFLRIPEDEWDNLRESDTCEDIGHRHMAA